MTQSTLPQLQNKRIILGVTGSIAAYKAVDLASKLTQAGAQVDVILTEAAQRFITPLTFQAVTGRTVYTDMWQTESSGGLPTHIAHVGLGEGADLLAVIPATANTLAKLAQGLADDLLSVTALAARCPLLIAPAMDGGMYEHPATQANIATLVERGASLVEPDEGRFASGLVGKGRLPETPLLILEIWKRLELPFHHQQMLSLYADAQSRQAALDEIVRQFRVDMNLVEWQQDLIDSQVFVGKTVVVTAGGTREPLDPVRYITNYSSGKQGHAIAEAAALAGAQVTLITTTDLPVPYGINVVRVETAQDMHDAVIQQAEKDVILIMAAAVADFRPALRHDQKIKKKQDGSHMQLELERTEDVLQGLKAYRERTGISMIVVGFAAESENILNNARVKLERKGMDLIVLNDITATDAGFRSDDNRVYILSHDQPPQELPLMSKSAVGWHILQRVAEMLKD